MSKKNWITWLLCGIMAITGASALTACNEKPDDSTPAASTPSESTPDESTPDESTPDESTPDDSTPDDSTPDAPPAATKYTVKFLNEDGSVISEAEYEAGETVSVPADPSKDCAEAGYEYVFAGWGADVSETATADATYTAAFNKVAIEYQVRFVHPRTGAEIADPITYTVESMGDVVFPAIPEGYQMTGYTIGWDKTPADLVIGGLTVNLGTPVANTYTITYDANGGEDVSAQSVTFDEEYAVASITREYYNFLGWYIVEDGAVTNTKLESGDAWVIAGNVTVQAKWQFIEGEYAMKLNFNITDSPVTQITKQAYAGGSKVSFMYYIPEGTQTGWWGIAWHTDANAANNYHAAGIENAIGYLSLGNVVGEWTKVEFTLPAGNSYYLYFGAEMGEGKGNWMIGNEKSYALIDDVKIGETTEDFNGGLEASIFNVNVAHAVAVGAGYEAPAFEPGEYAMKLNFNVTDSPVTQITKQAYAGGSKVSFKYYIPEGTQTGWWGIAWHTDASEANNYHAAGIENAIGYKDLSKPSVGVWTDVEITLPAGGPYYLYFGSEMGEGKGNWMVGDEKSYALIDNFTVGDIVETFNNGLEASIFNVNVVNGVSLADGYVKPVFEEGAYAMKYVLNAAGEYVSQITKKAYAAGSKVSLQYYIPETVTTAWWGLCWTTDPTDTSIYNVFSSGKQLGTTKGGWYNETVTLPSSGGPYYLYFGASVGEWTDESGNNPYILIDDFTVGSEKETFDKEVKDWAFEVLKPEAIFISGKGEGYVYVAPAVKPQAAKIGINDISDRGLSFVTANAYSNVRTITFDYQVVNNTNDKWWSLCWTSTAAGSDTTIYAHTGSYTGCGGFELPKANTDGWQSITVEIPEGEWRFYIGGSKGDWPSGYVIVDNIVLKDANGNVVATETFDEGFSVFQNNRTSCIFLVDGKTE